MSNEIADSDSHGCIVAEQVGQTMTNQNQNAKWPSKLANKCQIKMQSGRASGRTCWMKRRIGATQEQPKNISVQVKVPSQSQTFDFDFDFDFDLVFSDSIED